MKKTNVRTISTVSKNARQALLRDTCRALKLKTGLKGGGIKCDSEADRGKATPILM